MPQALLHNLKHNQVLHERNVILTVEFHDVPWVRRRSSGWRWSRWRHGFWQVQVYFGFMDTPDIPEALDACRAQGLTSTCSPCPTSSAARPSCRARRGHGPLARVAVRDHVRNAGSVAEFFRLPANCVVELERGSRSRVRAFVR